MRSIWRTRRDIGLVCLADGLVGASFGAIAVGAGLPMWVPLAMSVLVFAGAAQFIVVGVLAAGGNPLAAMAGALLVNARLIPLGYSVGDSLGEVSWPRKILGAHLVTDESVAFAAAEPDPQRRRSTFWLCGVGLFVAWNIGVLGGAFLGGRITDTAALGLDAAFPAVLIALVAPALRDPLTRNTALLGAVIAVAAALILPPGLPVLLALAAVVPAFVATKATA
ncbi:branched-chain amino acid transporter AzlC [Rhodococcus sp. 15-649-1-2]|uniref:AzlC family ABC transporter permease n=1 Tax=Rhodococcoides fascians TaxID=1828 RepID=UPI00037A24EC|nr:MULTISPECIES: AzlC family ABC transporter permease [Rhodococcus]OZC49979.1 branched-chain amino acid transporter AzlC [Rhodococcus sp. 06-621-2]OZC75551.1 branched-chain amino acid transporter AzlC [Rhodococcus sp. 06-418-1B]OZE83052.1 branched-chain amino acid transporter AzlC [Rhodococcus sp. 15-649-1-2]